MWPKVGMIAAWVACIGRILYTALYVKNGPNQRKLGGIMGGLGVSLMGVISAGWLAKELLVGGSK